MTEFEKLSREVTSNRDKDPVKYRYLYNDSGDALGITFNRYEDMWEFMKSPIYLQLRKYKVLTRYRKYLYFEENLALNLRPAIFTDGADLHTDWFEEFFDNQLATESGRQTLGFIEGIPVMLEYKYRENHLWFYPVRDIMDWHIKISHRILSVLNDSDTLSYATYLHKDHVSVNLYYK